VNYTIDTDIPPPAPVARGRPKGAVNPLVQAIEKLQPGQSIRLETLEEYKTASKARSFKTTVRKHGGCWRVWRTE